MCKRNSYGGLCKIWVKCHSTTWTELCIRQDSGRFSFESNNEGHGFLYKKTIVAEITRIDPAIIDKLENLLACCSLSLKIKTMNGDEWVLNSEDEFFEMDYSGDSGDKPLSKNFIKLKFTTETKQLLYG